MKYKSGFLIPKGSNKTLTDSGWEFSGKKGMSLNVLNLLLKALNINRICHERNFSTKDVKVDFFYLSGESIESIYLRDYTTDISVLHLISAIFADEHEVELFVSSSFLNVIKKSNNF